MSAGRVYVWERCRLREAAEVNRVQQDMPNLVEEPPVSKAIILAKQKEIVSCWLLLIDGIWLLRSPKHGCMAVAPREESHRCL